MDKPIQFLMKRCKCGLSDSINYKVYEHGGLIETIHIKTAEERLKKDIDELKDFGLNKESAIEATYKIWEKHLIVLQ